MSKSKAKTLFLLFLASTNLFLSGCKVFFPAHPNSNLRKGEKVVVQMLEYKDMTDGNYWESYTSALNVPKPSEPTPLIGGNNDPVTAGVIATAVIGMALDYTKKQLEAEATLYEAQFGTSIAADRFWVMTQDVEPETVTVRKKSSSIIKRYSFKGTNPPAGLPDSDDTVTEYADENSTEEVNTAYSSYRQNYYGINVTRKVGTNLAFKFVLGIAPSADGQFFRVAPIYFVTHKSKAKVLSDRTITYLAPWNWPSKLIKTEGHEISTTVSLDFQSFWKDEKQENRTAQIMTHTFSVENYDLTKHPVLTAKPQAGEEKIGSTSSGWLVTPPLSLDPTGKPIRSLYSGVFSVKATVTEKDPSNAKQYIEQAATYVGEQKDRLTKGK